MPSPYAPPEIDIATPLPETTSDLSEVRGIFYVHIAAILLLAVFSLSDNGLLRIPALLKSVFHDRFVQLMLLIPWFAGPIWMVVAAARLNTRSRRFRIVIVTLEVGLSMIQTWVMLPLVQ